MILNQKGLAQKQLWEEKHYKLPKFDRKAVTAKSMINPIWIHFGAGNIFRAFQANLVQNLLNEGVLDKGLIVAEGYDYEIIEKMNHQHDDYHILVTLKSDGNIEKTVIGSVVESLTLDEKNVKDFTRLKTIFCQDSLQMASFTITEKGYSLKNGSGQFLDDVNEDFLRGPKEAKSYMGKLTALLYSRFLSGKKPIAMVSMDNCSFNGDKLAKAVKTFAKKWQENRLCSNDFLAYINNPQTVTFPCTMIDKITPRPDETIANLLKEDGLENFNPIITSKNTYLAPFVNAEETEYLVIEDSFPNGRPALEKGGILFTNRETVDKVEKMKVSTCLNPLHTTLAIFGCLLGYKKISDEMKDVNLKKLVEIIGYQENLPVVIDPKIINPKEFIDTVLKVRIPNPFMPDTPQRIATDTSQKLAIRFGETIKAYASNDNLNLKDLKFIPLVFAAWLRYLMAVDDQGKKFPLSPDPLLNQVCLYVENFSIYEEAKNLEETLRPLLANKDIFGLDLYSVEMAGLVCQYFTEMIQGENAVRKTLEKYLSNSEEELL